MMPIKIKKFEECHKKLHEKDKSISNLRLVVSYLLIGFLDITWDMYQVKKMVKIGWKKSKKDDWKK